jgi:two-component system nitrate/nitrite response regulator NarL
MNMDRREKPVKGAAKSARSTVSALAAGGAGLPRPGAAGQGTPAIKRRIRLLVVDDHPVVRKGISFCLGRHPGFEVVGEAGDGQAALSKARELAPDIVVMDLDLPQMDGLAVTEMLRRERPRVKVLILSMHASSEYILQLIKAGARGYVLKGASPEELVRAIETVQTGGTFFSPEAARLALNQFVDGVGEKAAGELTAREREVLIRIADGLSNKEIAGRLSVGVRTVETHRERIMRKLNIHSIAGLTKYAIGRGWVTAKYEV